MRLAAAPGGEQRRIVARHGLDRPPAPLLRRGRLGGHQKRIEEHGPKGAPAGRRRTAGIDSAGLRHPLAPIVEDRYNDRAPRAVGGQGLLEKSVEVVLACPGQVHHETKNSIDILAESIPVKKARDHLIGNTVQTGLEHHEGTPLGGIALDQTKYAGADRRGFVDDDGKAAGIVRAAAPRRTAVAAIEESGRRAGGSAGPEKKRFRIGVPGECAGHQIRRLIGGIERRLDGDKRVQRGRLQHLPLHRLHVAREFSKNRSAASSAWRPARRRTCSATPARPRTRPRPAGRWRNMPHPRRRAGWNA